MSACTCLTENLGNHLAPRLHTAQVLKCPKDYSFVSNEIWERLSGIAGAGVSAAVNQWSPREAGGAESLSVVSPRYPALET